MSFRLDLFSAECFLCFGFLRPLNQCSIQVPSLGGDFEAINNELSGTISLNNYPNNIHCMHVVQADSSCVEIQIEEGVQDLSDRSHHNE